MQDKFSREETRAIYYGVFSILFCFVLVFLLIFTGDEYEPVSQDSYRVKATFGRTDGLLVGDKVRMAGVDVGRVVDAQLGLHYNATLTLEIKNDLKIPDDSSASIVSSGLMGDKYIEIEPGGSEDYIMEGGEFSYTQDAMVLEELLDRIIAMGKSKRKNNNSEETDAF